MHASIRKQLPVSHWIESALSITRPTERLRLLYVFILVLIWFQSKGHFEIPNWHYLGHWPSISIDINMKNFLLKCLLFSMRVISFHFIKTLCSILHYCFDLTERKNVKRTGKQLLERCGSFLDAATKTKTFFSGTVCASQTCKKSLS